MQPVERRWDRGAGGKRGRLGGQRILRRRQQRQRQPQRHQQCSVQRAARTTGRPRALSFLVMSCLFCLPCCLQRCCGPRCQGVMADTVRGAAAVAATGPCQLPHAAASWCQAAGGDGQTVVNNS